MYQLLRGRKLEKKFKRTNSLDKAHLTLETPSEIKYYVHHRGININMLVFYVARKYSEIYNQGIHKILGISIACLISY
jgi:hypothetical protein